MKKPLLALATCLVAASLAAAEDPVAIRGARALGMGDAISASVDDQNVFFYNPAGSVQRTGSLATLLDIPVTVSDDFVELVDYIDKNESRLKNFDTVPDQDLLNEINNEISRLRPTFGLGAPNMSYLSGPMGKWHWGLGLFGQASGRVGFIPDVITPSLYYNVNVDVVPMMNIAYHMGMPFLPGRLGLGINGKYIMRGQAREDRVSFTQLDSYDAPPLHKGKGYGVDLGALYNPVDRIGIAVTMMDLGGTRLKFDAMDAQEGFPAKPARDDSIAQRLNVGFAWTPTRIGFESLGIPLQNRLMLAADFRDLLNEDSKTLLDGGVVADSAGKHIHLGAEYRWWIFRLRGGANQGYLTLGAGLDLPMLKLDYAYFADEKGSFAGSLKHSAHILSAALRFGTNNTEARERLGVMPPPPQPVTAPAAKPASPEKAPTETPAP